MIPFFKKHLEEYKVPELYQFWTDAEQRKNFISPVKRADSGTFFSFWKGIRNSLSDFRKNFITDSREIFIPEDSFPQFALILFVPIFPIFYILLIFIPQLVRSAQIIFWSQVLGPSRVPSGTSLFPRMIFPTPNFLTGINFWRLGKCPKIIRNLLMYSLLPSSLLPPPSSHSSLSTLPPPS
jgi:hypothetical protein